MASADGLGPSSSSSSFPASPNSSTSLYQRRFSLLARLLNWPWRWMGGRVDPSQAELVSRWGISADDAASSSRGVEITKEFVRYLACLYLYNASEKDLRDFNRIIFLIEEAHWHYQDSFVDKYQCLKAYKDEEFTKMMFESCDFLEPYTAGFTDIYSNFSKYKTHIRVCGAVLLNATFDKCVLIKGKYWGFPKGKRSRDEDDRNCAIREVLEESGFDITHILKEEHSIEDVYEEQRTRLFIIPYVDEGTEFAPRTKNEIYAISWYPLDEAHEKLTTKGKRLLRSVRNWIDNHASNAAHIFSSELMAKKQNIAIFTAACPPLMIKTAVNPLFRAVYLAKDGNRKVCLVIPWLYLEDQKLVYPEEIIFKTPSAHEAYVREWIEKTTGLESDINICFFPGKLSREKSSILPVGDITLTVPDNEAEIAVLEEPEQLTSYRHGLRWKTKFRRVVGVVHTNYWECMKNDNSGHIQALILKYFSGWVINMFCHKVVNLSGAIHGVSTKYIDIGQKYQRGDSKFSRGAYYFGKIKGYKELLQMLSKHENQLQVDLYAIGEDADQVQKYAENLKLDVKVYTVLDHADTVFNDYKVFINPSTIDVVCTTTAEALAMGKIAVCANHTSNAFFKEFPNCHMYNNDMEFVNLTLKAQAEEPVPLTDELRDELSWEAATKRFVIAAELH